MHGTSVFIRKKAREFRRKGYSLKEISIKLGVVKSMAAAFLRLFRSSFDLDEKKFRVCIHLHEYHDTKRQLAFWSKVSQIKRSQFIKPFRKKHTGTRVRENYPGCASVYYQSADIARRLLAIGKAFLTEYGMGV
jgi:hypothetical protein